MEGGVVAGDGFLSAAVNAGSFLSGGVPLAAAVSRVGDIVAAGLWVVWALTSGGGKWG